MLLVLSISHRVLPILASELFLAQQDLSGSTEAIDAQPNSGEPAMLLSVAADGDA
jgi:hypothetical protein